MRTTVSVTSRAATAAVVGSISSRIPSHIRFGRVLIRTPLRKMAITTSSKDARNAKRAAVITAGRISGSVTLRNVVNLVAPSVHAACSRAGSTRSRAEATTTMTNGTARVRCASTRPVRVPTRP